MLLHQEAGDGIAVLAVAGPVADEDAQVLQSAVDAAVDARPRGVVVDLGDVTTVTPDAVATLRGMTARAPGWPRSSFGLCGAPSDLRTALPDLVVHDTRAQALEHVDDRPVPERAVTIEHTVHGPAQARRIVAECAERFGLAEAGDDLVLVVSELVTNAVRYGTPPVRLEVLADATTVLVAVADGSLRAPVPRTAGETDEGGRGMTLVDLLTLDHGVRPGPPGKTVWASVRRPAAPTS